MKRYFVANWKMNMLREEARSFCVDIARFSAAKLKPANEIWIAPNYTSLEFVAEQLRGSKVKVGSQNVHWKDSGAFTGEVSAQMLLEAGADFAIVGHSERRQYFAETDQTVSQRASAALNKGLKTIVCVGETREQFEGGSTAKVIETQLKGSLPDLSKLPNAAPEFIAENLLIAYEPVWAIGTGLAATPEIAGSVHGLIRELLLSLTGAAGQTIPILYGGSTTADNIASIGAQANVNGALIGGASLKADSLSKLVLAGQLQ